MTAAFERGWRPGVIGDIVVAHGRYYARDWGFGAFFEAKVAGELAAFVGRYDPARDLLLAARRNEDFLGAVVVDGSDPELAPGQAHLRWFITTGAARGTGLGGRLMAEAMSFLARSGADGCYLTTFAGLHAARRLYERHGFVLTEETQADSWGVVVREQRFHWRLSKTD